MYCQLLLLLLVVTCTQSYELVSSFYDGLVGQKVKSLTLQFAVDTDLQCAMECDLSLLCHTYSYNTHKKQCVFSDYKFYHTDFYQSDSNWITAGVTRKVLLLSVTKDIIFSAALKCDQIGATVATYSQMETAYRKGYNYCTVGWVQESYDSTNKYYLKAVSSSQDKTCSGNTGVYTVDTRMGERMYTWCVLQDRYKGVLGPETVSSAWVVDENVIKH